MQTTSRSLPRLSQRTPQIDVLANGKAGDVLYAGGYPNTVDSFHVNFRVPDELPGLPVLSTNPHSVKLKPAYKMKMS